jgi:hypothetical protein
MNFGTTSNRWNPILNGILCRPQRLIHQLSELPQTISGGKQNSVKRMAAVNNAKERVPQFLLI